MSLISSTGSPSRATTMSSGRTPALGRGLAGHHSRDLDPSTATQTVSDTRRQRVGYHPRGQLGPVDTAMSDERADETPGCRIEWHGQAEALPEAGPDERGVDAHHAGVAGRQGAAAVAGVERGVGLDHALDDVGAAPVDRGERPTKGRDDAGGDRAREAERAAHRDDQLADPQLAGVAQLRGGEVVRRHTHDREVRQAIAADHVVGQLRTVVEDRVCRPGLERRRAPT